MTATKKQKAAPCNRDWRGVCTMPGHRHAATDLRDSPYPVREAEKLIAAGEFPVAEVLRALYDQAIYDTELNAD